MKPGPAFSASPDARRRHHKPPLRGGHLRSRAGHAVQRRQPCGVRHGEHERHALLKSCRALGPAKCTATVLLTRQQQQVRHRHQPEARHLEEDTRRARECARQCRSSALSVLINFCGIFIRKRPLRPKIFSACGALVGVPRGPCPSRQNRPPWPSPSSPSPKRGRRDPGHQPEANARVIDLATNL